MNSFNRKFLKSSSLSTLLVLVVGHLLFSNRMHYICTLIYITFLFPMGVHCRNNSFNEVVGLHCSLQLVVHQTASCWVED